MPFELLIVKWTSGVGASFGSTLAVLAHVSLSRPWPAWLGGGDGC